MSEPAGSRTVPAAPRRERIGRSIELFSSGAPSTNGGAAPNLLKTTVLGPIRDEHGGEK